ncbi:amino acid transporter [Ophiobolus disseminans]|uniref:Amino acid transporter n=1 Tax=Ophiobolus disseminans TaxID=1469910 RepID=A0A6A7AK56_9PLEO|nr:amino acid transporter [Ophiobolus disseminans]
MELDNRTKGETITTVVENKSHDEYTRDQRDLIRLGKNPVLKRNFGFMQIVGFSCTVLVTWEGSISWVALLSPPSYRKFLSYITGWVTLIGWQATTAAQAYLAGVVVQSVILIFNEDYVGKPWQAMLCGWALLALAVVINTVGSKTLAHFEGLILILHVLGFFAILIPLVYLSPHNTASVFTTMINSGGWPTQGISFLVGMPSTIFCLVGVDSCVHMAEEVRNASKVVPRAIQISVLLNGTLGLGMMVAYLFCLPPVDELLEGASKYSFAYIYVFLRGTGSPTGGAVMTLLIWVLGFCCLVGMLAATSRQMWSFARDDALPFSSFIVKLNPKTLIPVNTIAITAFISMALSLISLGSTIAFNNIVNLSIGGLYASYFVVASLLLWRRLQGIPAHDSRSTVVVAGPDTLQWGPWKVPGALGVANNAFACVYLVIMWVFAFFPADVAVTAQSMNWSSVTFGGTVLFAVVYYLLNGRKKYNGPIVELAL